MNRRTHFLFVAGAMALAALLLVPRLRVPASFDGRAYYLPMARELLEHGFAYLTRPESLAYAPLAFIYPALLGASEALVREANIVLYCASIALTYFAARTAGSPRAGLIAAWLLAACPLTRPFIADVLTEPPFIFLTALWALSVAKADETPRGMAWIWIGGIALGLAALIRPAAMYFAPLAFLFFAWKRRWPMASLHGLAAILVGLWVLRNAIAFGFPAIASGAGGALYFGVNPLVDGFDPGYYGMAFDSGLAQDSPTHLTIHADRTLRAIALVEVSDTPLSVLIPMFVHKALAFLFVSSTENSGEPVAWLRGWRMAMMVFSVAGIVALRRSTLVVMLAAFAAYMAAVHVPLLYTHRYSVGALDFPLVMLAAFGIDAALRSAVRASALLVAGIVALGLGLSTVNAAPGSPMPDRIPTEVRWLAELQRDVQVAPGQSIDIAIDSDAKPGTWDLTMLRFDLELSGASCSTLTVRFRRASEDAFTPGREVRVPIPGNGMQRYTIGTTTPLQLDGPGTVRLEPNCSSPVSAHVGAVTVLSPQREIHYRDLYLARKP